MNSAIFKIGILIVLISIFIYVVKTNKYILSQIEKYKEKKIFKIIVKIMIGILFCYFLFICYKNLMNIKTNFDWYQYSQKNDEVFLEYDKKITAENKFYKENITNKNYNNSKYLEPYIPEGFSYVEGEWNTGFTIQDIDKNQYVWVPCTNQENLEIPKLQRLNFSNNAFVSKDICNNDEYEDFIISALENGGFYISRFEIGKENNKPVSKSEAEVWNNITRDEANEIIEEMYVDINCDLINGYAYDTTLKWIMSNNEIKENIIDVENEKIVTAGRTSYNNIYDFTDNVMELTSETTYSNVIIRGFPYEITNDNQEIINQNFGYNIENFDRFSIRPEDNYFTITTLLAFRTILYK